MIKGIISDPALQKTKLVIGLFKYNPYYPLSRKKVRSIKKKIKKKVSYFY